MGENNTPIALKGCGVKNDLPLLKEFLSQGGPMKPAPDPNILGLSVTMK